jgi:3-hydroxyacyl-[acyl-carrier-protein] dehydratase
MWQSAELRFASNHPTAAGHFPSNPIIPGALMLDEVVVAIAGDGNRGAVLIRTAKFLLPVRPGENVNLRWQSLADGTIKFECRLAGQSGLAMTGMLEIGPVGI